MGENGLVFYRSSGDSFAFIFIHCLDLLVDMPYTEHLPLSLSSMAYIEHNMSF